MKTRIATLAILLGLFISATAFASEPVPVPASKAVAESVADFIDDELEYPEFAIEDKFEGEVVLSVVIEDDGTLEVAAANSVNDELKEHVINVIENLDADHFNQYAGQTVLIKLHFDLLIS
jgi:hypothetical protein